MECLLCGFSLVCDLFYIVYTIILMTVDHTILNILRHSFDHFVKKQLALKTTQ